MTARNAIRLTKTFVFAFASAFLIAALFARPAAATDRPISLVFTGPDSTFAGPDTSVGLPDSLRSKVEFPRPDSTLVHKLRAGGYILLFRHCITDWSQRDAEGENFEDRAKQRNLSDEGDAQAAKIGFAINQLRIPISVVLASPMWRCRDTAQIAFGHHEISLELFRRGPDYRAARLVMLSTEPDDPTNIVLVTHQDLLLPLIKTLKRDQLKEGDAFVVKPEGNGKFEIIAQVSEEDWTKMAADEAVRDAAAAAKTAKPAKSTKPAKPATPSKTPKAGASTPK